MAYNSDGYIMFDFTKVDFRRTTQTIEGFYKRCVEIIGTNKFILVINANGKTPLPSVCSFVNNQYVIESCIYTFAITSDDTIIIKRNDPSGLIDDTDITTTKTWSSNKINTELNSKQGTLTAGANISIENNVISASAGSSLSAVTHSLSGTIPSTYGETFDYQITNKSGLLIIDYFLKINASYSNTNNVILNILKNNTIISALTHRGTQYNLGQYEAAEVFLIDNALPTDIYTFKYDCTWSSASGKTYEGHINYIN